MINDLVKNDLDLLVEIKKIFEEKVIIIIINMLRMNFVISWEEKNQKGMNGGECWRLFCQIVSFCVMFLGYSFEVQIEIEGNNKVCNQ